MEKRTEMRIYRQGIIGKIAEALGISNQKTFDYVIDNDIVAEPYGPVKGRDVSVLLRGYGQYSEVEQSSLRHALLHAVQNDSPIEKIRHFTSSGRVNRQGDAISGETGMEYQMGRRAA
ncbi:hypothetical protein CO038_00915 [Candidatus Pacearchaeota archaeon CG_4_9_14_0_2_um_filter_39_13]|nr:hypothetical protein [Candidatus Pacearchaeota archaeon]OIO42938.1 MAG: hypothetical protein AUJ64_03130 [Candidatus Pacearchaeota archaeon CG1_02_39_14]PJC44996.1 MAG: hypothetical protein CO038_00915 [Candidatus Pacearchaeota archaeon CG_4_9_14_0_2_um_filter_39_13]